MANIDNKQQLWQSRIEACQNSSMPAKQWCQENQIEQSGHSRAIAVLATLVFFPLPSTSL